jgi:hypothetical protein
MVVIVIFIVVGLKMYDEAEIIFEIYDEHNLKLSMK